MKTPHPSSPVSRRGFLGQLVVVAALVLAPRRSRAPEPLPQTKKLGVALVGLGGYSTHQLGPALRSTKHCQLTGVVTGSREKGVKWAHNYGFPERNVFSYDTMERMAGNSDIDIVYVATPNLLHAGHCIAAAKAGKHVICEKPLAMTTAESAELVKLAAETGRAGRHKRDTANRQPSLLCQ